jgi:hypothetical protein
MTGESCYPTSSPQAVRENHPRAQAHASPLAGKSEFPWDMLFLQDCCYVSIFAKKIGFVKDYFKPGARFNPTGIKSN